MYKNTMDTIFLTNADHELFRLASCYKKKGKKYQYTPQKTVHNHYYNNNSSFFKNSWLFDIIAPPRYSFVPGMHHYYNYSPNLQRPNNDETKTSAEEMALFAIPAIITAFIVPYSANYNYKKIYKAIDNIRTPRKIIKSSFRLISFIAGCIFGFKLGINTIKKFSFGQQNTILQAVGGLSFGLLASSTSIFVAKKIFQVSCNSDKTLSRSTLHNLSSNETLCLSEGQARLANYYLLGKIEQAKLLAKNNDIILRDSRPLKLFKHLRSKGLKECDPKTLAILYEYLLTETSQLKNILQNPEKHFIPTNINLKNIEKNLLHLQYITNEITPLEYKHKISGISTPSKDRPPAYNPYLTPKI